MAGDEILRAIAAVRGGQPVLLPTDTVYGLCAAADLEPAVRRLYRLKGRGESQPTALLAADLETLLRWLPELPARARAIALALLPGPFTLVLPNPGQRYAWLTGPRPEAIGVRVPKLPAEVRPVLAAAGAVAATSANDPGGPDPATLEDVPERIRAVCAAAVDAGRLSGKPSTVIDVTGAEPELLREGAVRADEAIARARAAFAP